MTARRRHPRLWIAGAAAALVVAATLSVATGGVAATGLMTPGETLQISGTRPSPTEDDPFATAPSVSADGSVAAYASVAGEDRARIVVADVASGTHLAELGDGESDLAVPSLSGDGRLLAYSATSPGYQSRGNRNADLYVAALGGANPDVRRITGTTTDLEYQRTRGCWPSLRPDGEGPLGGVGATDRCGPQLSGDGGSVAFEAELSLVSPKLRMTIGASAEAIELGYDSDETGVVDFGEFTPQIDITVRANGPDPVQLDAATVTGEAFALADPAPTEELRPCTDATVQPSSRGASEFTPDQECVVRVRMERDRTCATQLGTLAVTAPDPRGRTALTLAGEDTEQCYGGSEISLTSDGSGTVADESPAAEVCAEPAVPSDLPVPEDDLGDDVQVHALYEVDVDRPRFVAQTVTNTTDYEQIVHLGPQGCAMRFVEAGEPDGDVPPCQEGLVLMPVDSSTEGPSAEPESCTALVSLTPTTVGPLAGSLSLYPCYSGSTETCTPLGGTIEDTPPERVFRFVGAARRDVVVVRRDADGDRIFTGAPDPAAEVVSVDDTGAAVGGRTPSISADGRYVAFVSTDAGRLDGPQVLVHDTDRRGDGTHEPGRTVVASRIAAGAAGLPETAVQPSISGDGGRVAFVAQEPVPDGTEPEDNTVQVWVRDLALDQTVLASPRTGTVEPGDGDSHSPSLSVDGSTVSFASTAQDLTPPDADYCCQAVFLRDLGPDFGGPGERTTEILSLHTDSPIGEGASGLPAIDADGGVTVFASADSLLAEPSSLYARDQIYARVRFPSVTALPASLDFGPQTPGVPGAAQQVLVRNAGAGPARVQTVGLTGPYRITADGCSGRTLHRDESCVLAIAFEPTPAPVGVQTGTLTVTTGDFGTPPRPSVVELTGVSVPAPVPTPTPPPTPTPTPPPTPSPPEIRVQPAELAFPDTVIGTRSEPLTVVIFNPSARSIEVTGTVEATKPGSTPTTSGAPTPVPEATEPPGTTEVTIPDFLLDASSLTDCAVLDPGASCTLSLRFVPLQLGARTATLEVVGVAGSVTLTKEVALSGTTVQPILELSPPVTREGRVTFVEGAGFMPGVPLTLTWDRGPITTPRSVVADPTGAFQVPAVILMGAGAGQRILTVTMPSVTDAVESSPLLVVRGSVQPPDFVSRN